MPEAGAKIASAQEQVDAIKASLPKLKSTLNSLNSLTSQPQSSSALPMTKASANGNINNIKEYILALEERIEALEAYVYGDQSGSWTEATYATIEMYEETIEILAYIQCEIDALKGTLESTKEEILKDVTAGINDCCASMKSWVNEQLSGYYDIAETDAMLAKLQESLTADDEAVREEIEALRKDLAEQMDDMRDIYKSAIKSAIEENNGILDAKIEKAIKDLNAQVNSALEDMNKQIKDLEDRLTKLEGTVEALVKRIQSIAYIPIYDDERARVNFPNTDTSEGRLTLDFKISPKNAVSDLVKAARSGEVITVQAIYTGSAIHIDLPVVEYSSDNTQGIFTVTVACDNLNMDFYNGDLNARAIMYISDGNNDKNSEYIPLTPNLTHVSNNQIWYTVTGKTPVDLEVGNGPKIVSNSYDMAKACYVVTFDEPIYTIPSSYFAGKREVKTVSLPNSITRIEDSAFEECVNLREITLGNSVTSIGSKAFKECALTQVTLPESLIAIGTEAFDYSEIKSFAGGPTANDRLTLILGNTIKAVAFGGINDGKYSIPTGVTSVDADVFKGFTKITEVNIHDITAWCKIDFANHFSNPLYNGATLKSDNEEVADVIFPETMTAVKPYTFYGCRSLRSATLHNKVTTLGACAFVNCTNLSAVSLQAVAAPTFESNVFDGCGNLKIYIPSQEEAVKSYLSCKWYEQYKHRVVWNIDNFPKTHCIEYTTTDNKPVTISAANLHSHTYENGKGIITFTVPCTSFKGLDSGNERIVTFELPESVSAIAASAFAGCSSMTSFVIPEAVTAINASTFKGCSSLTELTIPQNLEEIGASAFENCTSLAKFEFPNKVTTINKSAFAGCVKLNNVLIHKGITTIGANAFAGCTGLTSLEFESATPPTIQDTSFDSCNNLKITIPTDEASVKAYLASGWSDATLQKIPYLLDPANLPAGYWLEYTTTDNQPVQFKDSNIFYSYYLNGKGVALSRKQITSFGGFASGAARILTCALPESVSAIAASAFAGCSSMTSFVIPEAVTAINASTFKGCSSLTELTIPQNLEEIGASAFENCTSLAKFEFPNKVTTINKSAFAGCVKLNNVLIHKGITTIGANAFAGCTGLTSLEFESATPPTIQDTSFDSCNNLKITIPTDEASVKAYLASGWSDATLQKIPYLLDPANLPAGYWLEYTTTDNQPVQFKDSNIFYSYYLNGKGVALSRKQITSFGGFASGAARILTCALPESVSAIAASAFAGCSSMTSFVIPEAVTAINASTFKGCSSLTELTIPQNLEEIGASAFENCTSLAKFEFPNKVTTINKSAFAGCVKLNNVLIHKGITTIGANAFAGCTGLTSLEFESATPPTIQDTSFDSCNNLKIIIPNEAYSAYLSSDWHDEYKSCIKDALLHIPSTHKIEYTTTDEQKIDVFHVSFGANLWQHSYENGKGTMVFYNKVTQIELIETSNSHEKGAFTGCLTLKSIDIPDAVTSIAAYTFNNCVNLTNITIGDGVASIGSSAFENCTSLTKVTIPDSVIRIGDYAFSHCSAVTQVAIGNRVSYIGRRAFYYCTKLSLVNTPNSLTIVSDTVFENCGSLPVIDNIRYADAIVVEAIGNYTSYKIKDDARIIQSHAFWGKPLKDFIIHDGITCIGDGAFRNCDNLESITIGKKVKHIGIYAFDCSSLKSVYVKPTTPPALSSYAFYDNAYGRKFYVPTQAVDLYNKASNWRDFANYIVGYDF